jgi:outer membrane lipoprotein LolB
VNFGQKCLSLVLLNAIFIVAGCAYPEPITGQNDDKLAELALVGKYRGRIALKIDPEAASDESRGQSFSAEFELSGNAQTGELVFFSPLGSIVAALNWTPQTAQLHQGGQIQNFDSLGVLLKRSTGADIPVASLFSWLAGKNVAIDGWQADLSQYASGRLVARRTVPTPAVEMRVIVEK